jgi:hypothetical protein
MNKGGTLAFIGKDRSLRGNQMSGQKAPKEEEASCLELHI